MRVGTWNMDGRWSAQHLRFLLDADCDVWLLTEVPLDADLPGFAVHRTVGLMGPSKTWSAVASKRPGHAAPDPHFATAVSDIGDVRFVSSILPWRSCGSEWQGDDLVEKARAVMDMLRPQLQHAFVIWGGDWNQALDGPELVGTLRGREILTETLSEHDLVSPTALLESATRGHRSIDHVAVPARFPVTRALSVEATSQGRRLSDHDAYVVEFFD